MYLVFISSLVITAVNLSLIKFIPNPHMTLRTVIAFSIHSDYASQLKWHVQKGVRHWRLCSRVFESRFMRIDVARTHLIRIYVDGNSCVPY